MWGLPSCLSASIFPRVCLFCYGEYKYCSFEGFQFCKFTELFLKDLRAEEHAERKKAKCLSSYFSQLFFGHITPEAACLFIFIAPLDFSN